MKSNRNDRPTKWTATDHERARRQMKRAKPSRVVEYMLYVLVLLAAAAVLYELTPAPCRGDNLPRYCVD